MPKAISSSVGAGNDGTHRRPILQRVSVDRLPGFGKTQRMMDILEFVYALRAVTAPMVEAVFFTTTRVKGQPKTNSNCQRYLRELYHRGFLIREEQAQLLSDGRKPLVYWLDQHGAAQLAINRGVELSELDWRPGRHHVGPLHLTHLLDTNRVRIAFILASRALGWTVTEWRDDLTLKRDHGKDEIILKTDPTQKKHRVEPDGFGILTHAVSEDQEDVLRVFLEVDRATTINVSASGYRDLATKIAVYGEFFKPGGLCQARYGTTAGRVLFVTTSDKRLVHMKRTIERHGGEKRYWLTTLEQATSPGAAIMTAPIWVTPGREVYRSLVKTTPVRADTL